MMPADRKAGSLQDLIDATPDLVTYLYNDTPGPHRRIRADLNPVPTEFSNWRDEQRAWRETAILFDQSHHMPELFVKGPDAFRLLNSIGINSLANLDPDRAKQFIGCNPRGQMIGDCILYDHSDQTGDQSEPSTEHSSGCPPTPATAPTNGRSSPSPCSTPSTLSRARRSPSSGASRTAAPANPASSCTNRRSCAQRSRQPPMRRPYSS